MDLSCTNQTILVPHLQLYLNAGTAEENMTFVDRWNNEVIYLALLCLTAIHNNAKLFSTDENRPLNVAVF